MGNSLRIDVPGATVMTTRRTADRKYAFSSRPYTFEVSDDPLYNGICRNLNCDGFDHLRPACMRDETSDCRTRKLYMFADPETFTFTAHDLYGYVLGLALLKFDGSLKREKEAAKLAREKVQDVEAWNKTQVCGGVLMSNHQHLITSMGYGHSGPFKKALNGELAKSLPGLMRRGGVEPFASVWDARNPHDMILANAEAALSRHLYCVMNPMLAGIVSSIDEYPGFLIRANDWGTTRTFKRPPFYFAVDKHPDVVKVEIVPPPALLYRWGGDLEALKRDVTRKERACEQALSKRGGKLARDAAHLLELDPWARPNTPRDRGALKEQRSGEYAFLGERPPKGEEARKHPTFRAHEQCGKEIAEKRSSHARARLFERKAELNKWEADDTRSLSQQRKKPDKDGKRMTLVREVVCFPYSTHKKRIEDEVTVADPPESSRLIRAYLDVEGNYLPYEDEVARTTESDRSDALALAYGWMEERIEQKWPDQADDVARSLRNCADARTDDGKENDAHVITGDAGEHDTAELRMSPASSRNVARSDDLRRPTPGATPRARRPDD